MQSSLLMMFMFNVEKTYLYWFGLIIFAFSTLFLFSIFWWLFVFGIQYRLWDTFKGVVPFIVGSIVFILIGLHMMKHGVKKSM
ncbi:MAG: hypothetical protein N3E39_00075 [Candidatus Methanomethylicia archaeon]|nr:hypothetical protein [Candidatus Methanomethylicia archaeon]